MKHTVKIIFGKEQVNKLLDGIPLSKEEKEINSKKYNFKTKAELNAFIKGVGETVGWMERYIVD